MVTFVVICTQRKVKERKETKEKHISNRENFFKEVLEIFYFKNWSKPWLVAETFFNHYEKTGWKDSNGREIEDIKAAARNWENHTTEGKNCSETIINNWQIAFHLIKQQSPDYWLFLYSSVKFSMANQIIRFRMNALTSTEIGKNNSLKAVFGHAFKTAFSPKQQYSVENDKEIANGVTLNLSKSHIQPVII